MKVFFFFLEVEVLEVNDLPWTRAGWDQGCQFSGIYFLENSLSLDQCQSQCSVTSNCTHYNWTPDTPRPESPIPDATEVGNCQMKSGNVHRSDARKSSSNSTICGLIPIQWNGESWAISCYFEGRTIKQVI